MRGKVARELRKLSKFQPNDIREYQEWSVTRKRLIMQLTHDNKVNYVLRDVQCPIIECVTGSRKVYQHLKKFYKGFSDSETLRPMPSTQELKQLEQQAAMEVAQEVKNGNTNNETTVSTTTGGGVPSSDEQNRREED